MSTFLRRTLYIALSTIDRFLGLKVPTITILCYHSFAKDDWYFSTNPDEFEHQVHELSKRYQCISLAQVEEYIDGKRQINAPSIVFTFDDGYQDLLSIEPILTRYKITPTVFLISQPHKVHYEQLQTKRAFLTPQEIKELEKKGWTFGSHTKTHPDLKLLPHNELTSEITQSKTDLEKIVRNCSWIAYPKGIYTPSVLKEVQRAGYRLGLSMDDGEVNRLTNRYIIPRIGVNRSHTTMEVLALNSPSCIQLRGLIKTFLHL